MIFGIYFLNTPKDPYNIVRIHGGMTSKQLGFDTFIDDEGVVDFGVKPLIVVMEGMVEKDNCGVGIRNGT